MDKNTGEKSKDRTIFDTTAEVTSRTGIFCQKGKSVYENVRVTTYTLSWQGVTSVSELAWVEVTLKDLPKDAKIVVL